MGKTKIYETSAGMNGYSSISKRAAAGKLEVINKTCKHCKHHKVFVGNNFGQNIRKCARCKKEQ